MKTTCELCGTKLSGSNRVRNPWVLILKNRKVKVCRECRDKMMGIYPV